MSDTKVVQGRVLKAVDDCYINDKPHIRNLFIQTASGAVENCRVTTDYVDIASINVGDVVRGTVSGPVKDMFNVVNLHQADISSKDKEHYKFGDKIQGTVTSHTGSAFSLDMSWYFFKMKLADGREIELSTAKAPPDLGKRVEIEIGNSMFADDGSTNFSLGFGNSGGMPMVKGVSELPEPRTTPGFFKRMFG